MQHEFENKSCQAVSGREFPAWKHSRQLFILCKVSMGFGRKCRNWQTQFNNFGEADADSMGGKVFTLR